MNKTVCCVGLVIQELQLILSFLQAEQLAVNIDKLRRFSVHRLGDPVAVSVVGIGVAAFTVGHARQPAPRCPGEGLAVVIGQRIADVVIGDRAAVKGGQKIAPSRVRVGVGVIALAVLCRGQRIPS